MRARAGILLALLLVPALAAGCTQSIGRHTPVVLVRHEVSWTGGPDAGRAEVVFGLACEMARYATDPPSVDLHQVPDMARPDFLVIHDYGEAWRAHVDAPDQHAILVGGAGSRGGLIEHFLGDVVTLGGTSALDTPTPFFRTEGELPPVRWKDKRPWLGDAPLEEGTPLVRTFAYDAPVDAGAPLRVTHRVEALYLGRIEVALHPLTDDCRTQPVLVGAPLAGGSGAATS